MESIIWSDKEAKRWQEGYPLGNGRIGAMVYGGIKQEIIELSEITFFSGEPSVHNNQPGAARAFSRMRSLLEEGRDGEAFEAAEAFIGIRHNYGTNLPVGRLILTFRDQKPVEDYRRELDLEQGLFRLTCRQGDTLMRRRAFASNPDQLLCYEIEADGEEKINASLAFDGGENPFETKWEEPCYSFQVKARESIHSDGSCGVTLNGRIRVFAEGGHVVCQQEGIVITACKRVLICLWAETDFHTLKNPGEGGKWSGQAEEATRKKQYDYFMSGDFGKEISKVLDRHTEDFSGKMKRVQFWLKEERSLAAGERNLPEEEGSLAAGERNLPTDERIQAIKEGVIDHGIAALQFQYGRYLLLSSSRENSPLPAHLQGVWNDSVASRIGWTCDMHLDINTQMNYWLSEPANLAECHKPLFDWMEETLIPSGRISARESYGKAGWCADLVSNAWGYSAPYWSRTISPCPTGGIWQASDYSEHYRYTRDGQFLGRRCFPVIREAVEFFIEYVFEDRSGRISSGPSISPENAFLKEGEIRYFSNGCTYELLMIKELFRQFIEICPLVELSEQEQELLRKVTEYESRLAPYHILEDQTLAEWGENVTSFDPWHRHTSHLLGLFPYAQITPDETQELARAAGAAIAKKLKPSEKWEDTGWARSMLLLYSARLRDRDQAYGHLKSMQQMLTHPNLLVFHPPTRGAASFMEVYELDGNTGFSMGVIELLMQSHNGILRLLPCLPEEWKEGSIRGLIARGGFEVTMSWKEGKLTEAVLKSGAGGMVTVEYTAQNCDCMPIRREFSLQPDKLLRVNHKLEVLL